MIEHQNTKPKIPISVGIPVKNEEKNLARCLERLHRFEEIIVIDSGSTDRTQEIAREFGARVVDFEWDGHYPKKRNWFLLTQPIASPWILFLDADEYVDDAFCEEVALATQRDDVDGFWLGYENYFLGRQMQYGLEQRKLALFRVGQALYERIDENHWSNFDMEIHEHPIVDGGVGQINCRIEHQDYKGLAHFISKHCEYAQWEVFRYGLLRRSPDAWAKLTGRQRFKYKNLAKWWYPWFYFVFTYFVKRGFLDGAAGLHYGAYKAWYIQSMRLMIHEMETIDANRSKT